MGTKKALTDGSTVIQIVGVLDASTISSTDMTTIWRYDTDKFFIGISKDGKTVKAWNSGSSWEAPSSESYVPNKHIASHNNISHQAVPDKIS